MVNTNSAVPVSNAASVVNSLENGRYNSMIIYAPFSTNTDISLRQPTLDFISSYMQNNKADILVSKDCTSSVYLYEQGFCDIIRQYPKEDLIIIEQDVVPTNNIMTTLKSADADLVENAYYALSVNQFQAIQDKINANKNINILPKTINNSVIYAFGLCKIKNKVLSAYIRDKGVELPDDISWIQFYDIFYAWYNNISYNNKKMYSGKKDFTAILRINNEIAVHNKSIIGG